MNDSYIYVIVALLPLAALMLVVQVNPYHALVIRGVLGAVAALVYAVLGAADVALTEALVGTMLAITLNAVAVRSSLVMRVGVLKEEDSETAGTPEPLFGQLMEDLRKAVSKYHLRLELVPYPTPQLLEQALREKEVHATCTEGWHGQSEEPDVSLEKSEGQFYYTTTRVRRLYEILQSELSSPATHLIYVNAGEKLS